MDKTMVLRLKKYKRKNVINSILNRKFIINILILLDKKYILYNKLLLLKCEHYFVKMSQYFPKVFSHIVGNVKTELTFYLFNFGARSYPKKAKRVDTSAFA